MIKPLLQDDAFLADVAATRGDDREGFRIWWLGQSGFLLQWRGRHLLFDPYLSDSLTTKYANTDKPHTRMTERVVAPDRLDFIDIVTSTHNHTDHLDADTLLPLMRANPAMQFVIPEANRAFVAERLEIDPAKPVGMTAGVTQKVGEFEFTGVPAAHNALETDEHGQHKYMGYVVRFGPWCVFHSGDTRPYPGNYHHLRRQGVDVALLPINGDKPERRVAGNFNSFEAALFAKDSGVRIAIPCHYEMFEFNTADPAEFIAACRRVGQRCRVLRAGERFDSSEAFTGF